MVDTVGTEAGEEDTMEGTLADTEAGIMVGIMEDTMAVIEVDTIEGSMVEVFTRIGDLD